jgi:DNA-binding Xre family transcriptional regulator
MTRAKKREQTPPEKLSPGEQIRIWMIRNRIKGSDLAREIGIHVSAITHFLNGDLRSERIRAHLIDKGCPRELLGDWIGARRKSKKEKATQ